MAFAYTQNQTYGTGTHGADYAWAFIATLLAAGWTKPRDSDGSTYSSSGAQVTFGGAPTQAGGLGNTTGSWVELASPDGKLHLTIQWISGLTYRVKLAPSAFTGGTPSAARTGSATNEQVVLGGGTDAAPTGGQLIANGDATGYTGQCFAETSYPWRCGAFTYTGPGGQSLQSLFVIDAVASYLDASDTFPWVIKTAGSSGSDQSSITFTSNPTGTTSAFRGWLGGAPGTGTFVALPCVSRYLNQPATQITPDASDVNALSGKWDLHPLEYERARGESAPTGFKGQSTLLFWRPLSTHVTGDRYTVAATGDAVVIGGWVLAAWNNAALTNAAGATNRGAARLVIPPVVAPDTTPPVIANQVPAPGTVIQQFDALQFDVTDAVGLAYCAVAVSFLGLPTVELAHDGAAFTALYAAGSSRAAIAGGYRFVLARAAGWPVTPTYNVYAIDTAGNQTP